MCLATKVYDVFQHRIRLKKVGYALLEVMFLGIMYMLEKQKTYISYTVSTKTKYM